MLLLEYKPARKGAESASDTDEFVPDAMHILFAEAYLESCGNISVACYAVGDASRHKYYDRPDGLRWNDPFQKWLQKYCKDQVLKRSGEWYMIAEKHARRGSYSHLEMLMQIAKEFTKESGGKVVVQNIINNKVEGNADSKFTEDENAVVEQFRNRLRAKHTQ